MLNTANFNTAIDAIRGRFFLLDEFPHWNRDRLPKGVIKEAMAVDKEDLEAFSYSLTGKQLEAILLDILLLKSLEEQERIAAILNIRFSPRLIKLFYTLYQTYYDVDAVRLILRKLIREAKRRSIFLESGAFFWEFGDFADPFEEVKLAFVNKWEKLDDFFEVYNIRKDTRLAMEIRLRCLEDAELPMIYNNLHHFMYLLERKPEKYLMTAITNYIYLSDVRTMIKEVCLLILDHIGEPSRSLKWEGYDRKVTEKFSEWYFDHHLSLHSVQYPKKYEILSKYYNSVRQNYELERSAFVIEFDKIVVVDMPDDPFSYFFDKWEFDRIMKEWDEIGTEPSFYKEGSEQISARDYIIENKDEPCIILLYEGVDLMYIDEILDIKIGLTPDFRQIKLVPENHP